MVAYEHVAGLADQLTLAEKVRLLERLSSAVKHDLELESYKHIPWEQFIDLTYGSLADDPIERNQPPADVRDEMGYPLGYFDETYGSLADDPIERNQPSADVRDEIE